MSKYTSSLSLLLISFLMSAPRTMADTVTAVFNSPGDVPVTSAGYTAGVHAVSFELNFAPSVGAELVVVNNTSLPFISGTFSNLAQGQAVALVHAGITYDFVANYYGGTGNDLVLVWARNRVMSWGGNPYGQLGNNSTDSTNRPSPVETNGVLAGKTVFALAAGGRHSLALCSDGTIAAWGRNSYGQLGQNNTTDSLVPVAVITAGTPLAGKSVVAIAAGNMHSLALCSDGTVAGWGVNIMGELGDGSNTDRYLPVALAASGTLSGKSVVAISAGYAHSLLLCSDGTVYTWGWNGNGQLGVGHTTSSSIPLPVVTSASALEGRLVTSIACGGYSCLALCSDQTIASWGWNGFGHLGDNSTTDRHIPVAVQTSGTPLENQTVRILRSGNAQCYAMAGDGTLVAWGLNAQGRLGDGTITDRWVPTAVTTAGTALEGKPVADFTSGFRHAMVQCSDGTLAAMGNNAEGQLGDGTTTERSLAVAVDTSALAPGEKFSRLFQGTYPIHSLAVVSTPQSPAPEIVIFDGLGTGGPQRQSNLGTLVFPDTSVGTSSGTNTITIQNIGLADLTNITVTKALAGTPEDFVVSMPASTTLVPNASTSFTVSFSPSAPGERTATILIGSNDSDENPFSIAVAGNGEPDISVLAAGVVSLGNGVGGFSFPNVAVGSYAHQSFTIRNVGKGNLTGLGISIDGPHAGEFSVVSDPVAPVTGGSRTSFTLRYLPMSSGVKTAAVHIVSNDPDESPFDIPLTTGLLPVPEGGEREPNNSTALATPLSGSTVKRVVANIFPSGDTDYYSLFALAGDRVYAAVMTDFSANGDDDSVLTLLSSDGGTVIEIDHDDGSFGSLSSSIAGTAIPSTGTYYLKVAQASGGQLRPYELWVNIQSGSPVAETESNNANPGQVLPVSGWISGATSSTADIDRFSFSLDAGDSVFLSLDFDPERDGVTWDGQLGLSSFGSTDSTLSINDGNTISPNSEAFFMTVKNPGTYSVRVGVPAGSTNLGTYNLSVGVLPAPVKPTSTYMNTNAPILIPDGPGEVTSSITVPDNKRIGNLKVLINLTHNLMQDLDVSLTSPDGNVVALFTDIGSSITGSQVGLDFELDDTAAATPRGFSALSGTAMKPELRYRLAWFQGQQAQGTWTLTVRDDLAGNGGVLHGWGLVVEDEEALPAGIPTGVYSNDFEASDGGFTHSGTGDEWEWGTPSYGPITTASSGVKCWKTDLDNSYDFSPGQDLYSPIIDLTVLPPASEILFQWSMKYQLESATYDGAFVEVREVGGSGTSRQVWEWTGPTMTNSAGDPPTFEQEAAGWGRHQARISDFAGKTIQLRFHLRADSTINLAGLAIDDVMVTAYEAPPTPYELWATQWNLGSNSETNDPDVDGYINLLEYVTGGNPTNADVLAGIEGHLSTNNVFALRFNRNTNANDITLIAEGAYSLTNDAVWEGIATNLLGTWGGAANVAESGPGTPVIVTIQDTTESATNRFLRLRVTKP